MKFDKWIKNWKSAVAENFFLRFLLLLLAVALIANGVFKRADRIIVSPPAIEKQFWVDQDKASKEYLEQMGVFLATLGGNLSPGNAEFSAKVISGYAVTSKYNEVFGEMSSQALYIKKNNIQQSFFPVSVNVDEQNNQVLVMGTAVRGVGTTTVSRENVVFKMKFELKNYKLYLDEYYVDYPDRSKEKMKEQEDEARAKKEQKNKSAL